MTKKRIAALVISFVLITSNIAYADVLTKQYSFRTTNPDYSSYTVENIGDGDLKDIPRKVNNNFFTEKSVTAIKIVLDKETLPEEVVYENLPEKVLPKGAETYEDLPILETKWDEVKREKLTGTMTIRGKDEKPDFPATKEVSAKLINDLYIKGTGKLVEVKVTGASYAKPFAVKAKFWGDEDVEYYLLDGREIPNNPHSPEFVGYENIILKKLGLNPSRYRITTGKWLTGYTEENGETVRLAEFSGTRLANDWTAYYEETLTEDSPNLYIYTATVTYGENLEPVYDVTVTVEYDKTEIRIDRVIYTGVILIILAIVIIAFLLAKKKKKKEVVTNDQQ